VIVGIGGYGRGTDGVFVRVEEYAVGVIVTGAAVGVEEGDVFAG